MRRITTSLFALILVATIVSSPLSAAGPDVMTFQVNGGNPGGVGGYTGEVTLTKLSKTTAKVRWVAGAQKQVTEGFAVKTEGAIGTAYGPGLYALAVYELQGRRIHATWSMATKPEESGVYELQGADYEGRVPFADGVAGSVTFTAAKGGLFKVAWDLATGHFEGIGLRMGNVLVAASGNAATGFGIGAYVPKEDLISGLWATTQMDAPGTETWSLPNGNGSTPPAPVAKKGSSDISPELVTAIKGDLDKCGATAQQFVGHLQAGETQKAVGLMSDTAFTKVSREAFLQSIEKSNGVFGALKRYKPDKSATDFGVTEGVMTFTLQADAEYANANVRETLKFIRNDKGGIEFIGYNRTAKE